MAEAKFPLTNAVREQFDYWDMEAERLHKQAIDYAKKKAKQLIELIKEWVEKETDDLNQQKEDAEKSPLIKMIEDIKEFVDNLIPDPEKIAEIIQAIKNIVSIIEEIISIITNAISDITMALAEITTRTPATLARLTGIISSTPSVSVM